MARTDVLGSIVHYKRDVQVTAEEEQRTRLLADQRETQKRLLISRTKYVQPILPLDKPFRGCLRLVRIRQVDRKPNKLARVVSHPLPLHPPYRVLRLCLAPRGKVHLRSASHKVERNV